MSKKRTADSPFAIQRLECQRCVYVWIPRQIKKPVKCPNCQAKDWEANHSPAQRS